MIIGKVTSDLETVIELDIGGSNQWEKIECIVDTGFSGYLALPSELINQLSLPIVDHQEVLLGDGTVVSLEKYLAKVLWHGEERSVSVLCTEGGSIAGMYLLLGSRLILDVIENGEVSIDTLSSIL